MTEGRGKGLGSSVAPRALDAFLSRIAAERVASGLPEVVEDVAALDIVATILDRSAHLSGPHQRDLARPRQFGGVG